MALPDLDVAAIGSELVAIVDKLQAERGPERRWTELIAKADSEGLNDAEKAELLDLQRKKQTRDAPTGR